MGIKSDIEVRAKAVAPTKDQLRLAQLTMDNGVSDDEEAIKRLIKKVIETTLCSASRAEIALFDNDNDVDAAVLQILENPSEDWVEKGKKKEKKRDEEIRSGRGQSSQRGRLWSDKGAPRGGGARGAGAAPSTGFSSRGASRGGSQTGRGRGGSTTRPVTGSRSQAQDVPKTVPEASDIPDENKDWKSGPLVFKRSDETESYTVTSSASVSSAVPASQGPPAPFSFAAVAAAGANKEKQRQQQTHPQASHSALAATEEPVPSGSSEITEEDVYEQVDEAPRTPSPVPAAEEEPSPPVEQSPVIQANDHWTNQLKNDLGIGLAPPPAVQFAGNAASPSASLPPQTVEFVSEAAPTVSASATSALPGYQFGFLVEPSVNVDVERPAHTATASSTVNVTTESLFSRSQVASQQQHPVQTHQPQQTSQPSPPQQKPEFQESVRQMSNGDFSQLKTSPPVSIPSYGQPSRGLSYDTSSVSYAPQEPRAQTAQHMPKPPMQQQQPSQQPSSQHASQQQQQPPGSQHSQQMQYPHQMPYGNYPYMNMYSPVAGLRADDPSYAAAALMQYPFGMGQIDLSTILPQNNISQSQPTAQPQHRSDSHGLMDMKGYQSGVSSSRDSSVAPPPGFANPNPFVPQHGLSNLFMQQQYAAHSIPFMMPSVGGRQMYGGAGGADDERKGGYDSGRGTKTGAQATPPPHYPTHGGYLGGLGKPKPQPQPYGHAGWNN